MDTNSMNNCGAGSGREVMKMAESSEGHPKPMKMAEFNRKMDEWLAKREGREVKAWKRQTYGKNQE
tara:strand:+ start:423 stop:620 length:198 start_codon:yes stop_codon:yes gene_type:complete